MYVFVLRSDGAHQVLHSFPTRRSSDLFGLDVNPVPDRMRVVSDSGQNIRLSPSTGTHRTSTRLHSSHAWNPYAGLCPTEETQGYTNDFVGASSTVLYGIEAGLDRLVRH